MLQDSCISSFFFIRHGHTDPFCQRLYCGGGWNAPLNQEGKKQAKFVGDEFKSKLSSPSNLYVSPMQRTIQTAQHLQIIPESQFSIEDSLREWDLGEWDGLSWEKLPSIFDRSISPPSSETRELFEKRIELFISRKINNSKNAIVVSHGLVWNAISYILSLKETELSPCGLAHVTEDEKDNWSVKILHKGFPL